MKQDISGMPIQHRNLYTLIWNTTGGNMAAFSRHVGCSQQMLDKCFKKNAQGEYQTIYPSVKEAVKNKFGIDDSWFFTELPSSEEQEDKAESEYITIIGQLTQANLLHAEANRKHAINMETLINMLQKKNEDN